MHAAFQFNHYHLRRQVLALTGKLRIYNSGGQLTMYTEQKMFKLKEEVRVFADESKQDSLLHIKARQIIDFAAAYDVVDTQEDRRVGVLRRKGFRSMVRDQWEVLDAQEQPLGILQEDSVALALVRRFLSSLVPQNFDLLIDQTRVADIRQRFNPFRYELNLDFSMDTTQQLDRRLGIAIAVLLAIIERRQE